MSVSIVNIAEAVKDLLNTSAAFSVSLNAVRAYVPEHELTTMNTLKTTVVPRSREREVDGRSRDRIDHEVMIAIQKRANSLQALEVDTLIRLVEEVEDWLAHEDREQIVVGGVKVVLAKPQIEQLYSPSQLRRLNQFTAGIILPTWTLE